MGRDQDTNHSRFGVFGDMPTRAMIWGIKSFPRMPFVVEASLLYFFTFVVFLFARQQRRSIRANLKAIYPDFSWAEGHVGVFKVFRNFGWAYIDSIRVRFGQDVVTWDVEGMEVFEKIRADKEAAMLFTTHTGNYDLAAALFAGRFERILHTVRVPERSSHLSKIRNEELDQDMHKNKFLKVLYNQKDSWLGVQLAKLLAEGGLLAIQCDRVIGDVVHLDVPIDACNQCIRIPKGPMTLACFSKCPCYPLFVVRDGFRHYRVIFEQALVPVASSNTARFSELDYGIAWARRLRAFLEVHGQEWFVFEDAFTSPRT